MMSHPQLPSIDIVFPPHSPPSLKRQTHHTPQHFIHNYFDLPSPKNHYAFPMSPSSESMHTSHQDQDLLVHPPPSPHITFPTEHTPYPLPPHFVTGQYLLADISLTVLYYDFAFFPNPGTMHPLPIYLTWSIL